MISPNFGETFVSPFPLELSLDRCSHNCPFCFSILNTPDRRGDMGKLMRFLSSYQERETLEAKLLQQGYPIALSNHIDPFSRNNAPQLVPVIQMATEMGIRFGFQTRGGIMVDEVIDAVPPSLWYVSINQQDDEIRARIEPQAPTIESRWALIERLVKAGHSVNLGFQPYVPEWVPDPEAIFRRARDLGVHGVWPERLHFSHDQAKRISASGRRNMGDEIIQRATRRSGEPVDVELLFWVRDMARELGLEVFSTSEYRRSDFWAPARKLYPKTFGISQDFVNWCYDHAGDEQFVSFNDYWRVVGPRMPEGTYRIGDTVRVVARNVDKTHQYPRTTDYETLARIVWSEPRVGLSPVRARCFTYPVLTQGEEQVQLADEAGVPLYAFSRLLYDQEYTAMELADSPGTDAG